MHASEDGTDVATSTCLIEWFLNFYDAARESRDMIECVVGAGELLFVPRGWWHMALNLEESVAITQNFVSRVTLPHVLGFLATRNADLVSGCDVSARGSLHERFLGALRRERPELLRLIPSEIGGDASAGGTGGDNAEARGGGGGSTRLADLFGARGGVKGGDAKAVGADVGGGFKFNFG